jgi:hypothetical protein
VTWQRPQPMPVGPRGRSDRASRRRAVGAPRTASTAPRWTTAR